MSGIRYLDTIPTQIGASSTETPTGEQVKRDTNKARTSTNASPRITQEIDYTYYQVYPDPETPHSLIKPILERFPFQPPMPASNPAISYDYLAGKTLQGSPVFVSQLRRLDQELAFIMLAAARIDDQEFRYHVRVLREEMASERFDEKQFDMARRRVQSIIEHRIEKLLGQRIIRREMATKEFMDDMRLLRYLVSLRDTEKLERREAFLAAVEKAMEKKPYDIAISGFNEAYLFAAMREEEFPSRIIAALRKVKLNVMIAFAMKLLEHMSRNSIPSPIYNRLAGNVDRKKIRDERVEDRIAFEQQRWLLEQLIIRDARRQASQEFRMERLEAVDQRIAEFWEIYDLNNATLRLDISFSSLQSVNSWSRHLVWQEPTALHRSHERIDANLNMSHSEQILERLHVILGELLTPITNHVIYFDSMERLRSQTELANRKVIADYVEDVMAKRKDLSHEKANEIREELAAKILEYWQLFDHNHETIILPMSFIVGNTNDVSQLLTSMEPTQVLHFFKNAKDAAIRQQRMQINNRSARRDPAILTFNHIAFVFHAYMDEKSATLADAQDVLRDERLADRVSASKDQIAYIEEQFQQRKEKIRLPAPSSVMSEQDARAQSRYMTDTTGLKLEQIAKDNRTEALANQLAAHANNLNDPQIRAHVDPADTVNEHVDIDVVRDRHKVYERLKHYEDSKMVSNTVVQTDSAQQLEPKSDPIPGQTKLTVLRSDSKVSVVIDTYQKHHRSVTYRLTPNLDETLSGFESQYIRNSPTAEAFNSSALPGENSNHYPDIVESNRVSKVRKNRT